MPDLPPEPEPVETILDEPAIEEPIDEEPAILDNIAEVEEGNAFVAKLRYVSSSPFRRGRGTNYRNNFKDQNGKSYVSFSNGAPFEAEEGSEVYVRGIKGATNARYRNTQIKDLKTVSPDKVQEYGGTEIPEETIPEAIETPEEIIPETKAPEEVGPITKLTNMAKAVVSTGKTRDGRPMDSTILIPLYVDQLSKHVKNLNTEEWLSAFRSVALKGNDALLRYLDTIPTYLGK